MQYRMRRRTFLEVVVAVAGASVALRSGPARADDISSTEPDQSGLTIGQTVVGNVFIGQEPVRFSIATTGDSVLWTVWDYRGAQTGSGSEPVSGKATLQVAVPGPGHYQLQIVAERQQEQLATARTTFAVLEPFDITQIADSPFGVNTHFGQQWPPALIPLLAKGGIKNVRDEIRWADVEQTKEVYAIPSFDATYMGALQESHIDPLIIFDYVNSFYDNGATPYTDAGRAGFADYATAVVRLSGSQIKWAEVYNEFNLPVSGDKGNGPADARADYYFLLLKATYEQVKAQDPDITIVGPVVNGVALDWLQELFELGGLQYLDVVSVHLYPLPDPPEVVAQSLTDLQQLIRQYNGGRDKPVWVTEEGWPTYSGSTGVSPSVQASYFVRAAGVAMSHGVDKYFQYDFMNDGIADTQPDNQGLVANTEDPSGQWSPKPSYVSYAVLIRQLTGASYAGQDAISEGVYSLIFANGSERIRVIWSAQPATVAVFTAAPLVATDLMGNSERCSPDQGRVYVTTSAEPIYLTGAADRLAVDGRFALASARGGTAILNDPIPLTFTVDNTTSPRSAVMGEFEIAGMSIPISVPADTRRAFTITLPPEDRISMRGMVGRLVVSNQVVARLTAEVDVAHPIALEAKHVLAGGADVLTVTVTNAADNSLAVGDLTWQIGALTGTAPIAVVSSRGSRTLDISLSGLATAQTYPMQLRLPVPTYPDVTLSGVVTMVAQTSLAALPKRSITVDGVLDDLGDLPSVDLTTDGTLRTAPGYTFGGASDLSGDVWVTWGDDHLYLSARVHDDTQHQPYGGWQLSMGDSIQLAMTPGLPGESQDWYLATLALTPEGPQLYFTHNSNAQLPVGPVSSALIGASRNESSEDTIYELAIPWSDLPPFQPGDRLLSVAVQVNDNDGTTPSSIVAAHPGSFAGRNDWIEWGGGASLTRSPNLYRAAVLDG